MENTIYNKIANLDFILSIDRHFALFCQRLHGSESDLLKSAALLCSNRVFRGDIYLDLNTISDFNNLYLDEDIENISLPQKDLWIEELKLSSIVGSPGEKKPLILNEDGHLYLYRYWHYEKIIHKKINQLIEERFEYNRELAQNIIEELFDIHDNEINYQALSALMSLQKGITVISGGPGTGKTTTAIKILILLCEDLKSRGVAPLIKLCAPTGKASTRLIESIGTGKSNIDYDSAVLEMIPDSASTIHRLLGAGSVNTHFRFNEENPLNCNILLIDETSMVESSLMANLLSAINRGTRVIMLGDMHQLTSVGAGSVFSDICNSGNEIHYSDDFLTENSWLVKSSQIKEKKEEKKYGDFIVKLQKSYRFNDQSGIGMISKAVLQGDADRFFKVLKDSSFKDVEYYNINESTMKGTLKDMIHSQINKNQSDTYDISNSVMLSPVKKGLWGTEILNSLIVKENKTRPLVAGPIPLYEGMPIIINSNNYSFDLYNGDIAVVIDDEGEAVAFFKQNDKTVPLHNLSDYSQAYCLTIHRSQGSEYNSVFLIMPRCRDSLLTRELLYTAITRAREKVIIISEDSILRKAITGSQKRRSSLGKSMWN